VIFYVYGEGGLAGKTACSTDIETELGIVKTANIGTNERGSICRIEVDGLCLANPPGIGEVEAKMGLLWVDVHAHYRNQVGPGLKEVLGI
jgi:hypothetical protein